MAKVERIGKYEVAEQIGMGGFGVVYKAWDPYIQRWVALKTCNAHDPETTQRFFREAQLAGNLQHPNITMIYDFGVEGETPYFVQEFLSGVDLDELLAQKGLSLPATLAILLQVCEGLEYAHSRGIIHRDIKPANIRVLEDGTVKIMDFGIAKSLQGDSRLTQTGVALGTAGYLAPEQLSGSPVDHRADLFSLGVMAYEMVTGVRPFAGPNLSNVIYQILHQDPTPPRQRNKACPERLESAILKALAKNPAQRYSSVREFARELKTVLEELPRAGPVRQETTTAMVRAELARLAHGSPADLTAPTQLAAAPLEQVATEALPAAPPRRWPGKVFLLAGGAVVAVAAAGLWYWHSQEASLGTPALPTPLPSPRPTPMPPTPLPTPSLLTVTLLVDPPAEVELDGKPLGKVSSQELQLSPGKHRFRFRIPGFLDRTEEVEVGTSGLKLSFQLPRFGVLSVSPDLGVPLRGAVVELDDKPVGELPLTEKKLSVGSHRLRVTWPDGSQFETTLIISDVQPTRVVVRPQSVQ